MLDTLKHAVADFFKNLIKGVHCGIFERYLGGFGNLRRL